MAEHANRSHNRHIEKQIIAKLPLDSIFPEAFFDEILAEDLKFSGGGYTKSIEIGRMDKMTDEEALIKYYGGRPQYSFGKLSKIGDRRVEYSFDKISRIGTDRVEYSFGEISRVGGNRVQRSFGEISYIGPV